jgi:hypothetical protein
MKEIEVVVDVRPSPDTPELIIVKQKLATGNGDVHVVGAPAETRVGMAARRARLVPGECAEPGIGYALTARVLNVSLVPLEVTRVAIEFQHEPPREVTVRGAQATEVGTAMDFLPKDPGRGGPLQPGEARDYYLPGEMVEAASQLGDGVSPDRYGIAAYAGNDRVAWAEGRDVRPYLDRGRVRVHRRARPAMDALRESDRLLVLRAAGSLLGKDPARWAEQGLSRVGPESVYLMPVSAELRAFVRPVGGPPTGPHIEILDLVREETLRRFADGREGAGARG